MIYLFLFQLYVFLKGKSITSEFSQWGLHQPNDYDGSKDCVAMANDGNYSDEDCNQKMNFVCKKSRVDLTQNPTCETYDIGELLDTYFFRYRRSLGKYNFATETLHRLYTI